jgi:membrane fusion protein, multidrug efflux system
MTVTTNPIRTALLATLALVAAACSGRSEAQPVAPVQAAVAVAAITAAAQPTDDYLVVTGNVVADEHSDVAADTAGKVVQVFVQRGSAVKAGDPLVRLDVRSASLSAEEARAQLASARAQNQLANLTCERSANLFAKGAITKAQYDREQTECTASVQSVAAADTRLRMAGKAMSDGVIRAPFAGVIAERLVDVGEYVAPGARLAVMVDNKPLRLELTIPEAEVARVSEGQKVAFSVVAHRDLQFHGTVRRLGAELGKSNRSLTVEAAVEDGAGKLRPGMFAEARLVVGQRPLPVVPRTALRKNGASWRLFAVVDGRAEERIVRLGQDVAGGVAIERGLAADERVIAPLTDAVVDGSRLQ